MKLFDFRKSKSKPHRSPKEIMEHLIDYMPESYKTNKRLIGSVEFLKHREWKLALDSLIELADETKHYFPEQFWLDLIDVAYELKSVDKTDYCRNQIERNKQELKFKIPFGWTTTKFDDTHFEQHISKKLKQEWATERRKKDEIGALIATEGVHLKSHGRDGYFYVVDNGQLAEVEFELGVNGLILYFNTLTNWILPSEQILTPQEKQNVRDAIVSWSTKTKNAIVFSE